MDSAGSPVTPLDPAVVARLSGLELRARTIVEGHLVGLHRSPRRGFSVEFAEHRSYSPGDDLRYLDWKLYGKRDRHYLKQFEEETNFACHLLVDCSESMAYRSEKSSLSKFGYAATLAASLAWLVLHQQDAVGLTLLAESPGTTLQPSGQASQLKQVLHALAAASAAGASRIGPALDAVAERIPRRGLIVLISDLFDDIESVRHGLKHLVFQGHDVSVLQVIDPAEQDFPFEEATAFDGLEGAGEVSVEPRQIAGAYREEFGKFLRITSALCRDLEIDYHLARTDAPAGEVLQRLLSDRRVKSR